MQVIVLAVHVPVALGGDLVMDLLESQRNKHLAFSRRCALLPCLGLLLSLASSSSTLVMVLLFDFCCLLSSSIGMPSNWITGTPREN